jgi:hypothetical protein
MTKSKHEKHQFIWGKSLPSGTRQQSRVFNTDCEEHIEEPRASYQKNFATTPTLKMPGQDSVRRELIPASEPF